MQPFFVSPAESLLIGLALGGYLQRKENGDDVSFLDVVESWTGPFVPPTWSPITSRFGEKDSDGIVSSLGDLMRFNECNETFEVGREFGRVVGICEDYAARLTRLEKWTVRVAALERKHPFDPEVDDGTYPTVQWNASKKQFETVFDPDVDAVDDIEESEWQPALDWILCREHLEVYTTTLQGVIVSPMVKRSMYARQCLAYCSMPEMVWSPQDYVFRSNQRNAIQHANRSRAMLWLAFGELIGFLRDADSLARSAEWTSAAPRSLRELFDASGGKVRNAIREAELALSADTSEDTAARAVEMVANCIEALAKRICSIQSSRSQQTQNTLMQELMSKQRSGTEDEQRFASIAITLYKSYRNPVVHEYEKFQCSVTEARFFVLGMRTLLDLSDRISATGKGDK